MTETLWTLIALAVGGFAGYWIGWLAGWESYHRHAINSTAEQIVTKLAERRANGEGKQ